MPRGGESRHSWLFSSKQKRLPARPPVSGPSACCRMWHPNPVQSAMSSTSSVLQDPELACRSSSCTPWYSGMRRQYSLSSASSEGRLGLASK